MYEISPPRRPESALPARRFGKIAFSPFYRLIPRHDQLRDPVARMDRVWSSTQIQQDHANLAAIAGVDRARRIRNRDRMLEREPAARPHLPLIASGNLYREPRRHHSRDA